MFLTDGIEFGAWLDEEERRQLKTRKDQKMGLSEQERLIKMIKSIHGILEGNAALINEIYESLMKLRTSVAILSEQLSSTNYKTRKNKATERKDQKMGLSEQLKEYTRIRKAAEKIYVVGPPGPIGKRGQSKSVKSKKICTKKS